MPQSDGAGGRGDDIKGEGFEAELLLVPAPPDGVVVHPGTA